MPADDSIALSRREATLITTTSSWNRELTESLQNRPGFHWLLHKAALSIPRTTFRCQPTACYRLRESGNRVIDEYYYYYRSALLKQQMDAIFSPTRTDNRHIQVQQSTMNFVLYFFCSFYRSITAKSYSCGLFSWKPRCGHWLLIIKFES